MHKNPPLTEFICRAHEPDSVMATKYYNEENATRSLVDGSIEAFGQIYDRYADSVYDTAYWFLKSDELARDLVQDVFTTLWLKRTQLSSVQSLKSYLKGIVRNKSLDYLLKVSQERTAQKEFHLHAEPVIMEVEHNTSRDSRVEALRELAPEELNEIISEAVESLPPQQKQIFLLRKDKRLSYKAIAELLKISPHTAENHMAAAYNSIRRRLEHRAASVVVSVMMVLFFE